MLVPSSVIGDALGASTHCATDPNDPPVQAGQPERVASSSGAQPFRDRQRRRPRPLDRPA